jgi:hypothetical protein
MFLALLLVMAALPLVGISAASAASKVRPGPSRTVERIPFEFTMGPEQCSMIDTTISGSGEFINTITRFRLRNGKIDQTVDSVAQGTATDSEGGTYWYSYHFVAHAIIPRSGGYVEYANDTFSLTGDGTADGLYVHWEAMATFAAQGQPPVKVEYTTTIGDPACDPI